MIHLLEVPTLEPDTSTLSPDELARAARYRFDADRRTFVFARATLRRLLAGEVGAEPAALVFDYGAHGKPRLSRFPELEFNLAHTREAIAIAIAAHPVGIDIERVAPERAALDGAASFFAPAECAALARCAPESRHELFFALWTLKEAYVKARGEGLSLPLDGFEFDVSGDAISFTNRLGDFAAWDFSRGAFGDHVWALAQYHG